MFGAQRATRQSLGEQARLRKNAYSNLASYATESDELTTKIGAFGRIVFLPATQEMIYLHSETVLFGGQTDKVALEGAIRHDYCD
jgi:hypothetical protein